MLQKNKDKIKRKESRHKFMGRPVRFKKKTAYNRNERKRQDKKEKEDI